MFSRWGLIGIAVLSMTAGIAAAQDLPKNVRIAVEGAYPPWNLTTPDGKLSGYEVDVVKAVCERIKIDCSLVPQEWSGMIPGLNAGKFDAISGMGVTEERKKVVSFSKPYARTPNGFLVAADGPLVDLPKAGETFDLSKTPDEAAANIETIKQQLAGKTIGVQGGTAAAFFANKYFGGLNIVEYKTFEQLGLELTAGRIDLAIGGSTAFKPVTDADPNLKAAGPTFSGGVLGLSTVHVVLRQADGALREAFDNAITEINHDGTNRALTEKWFGMDISIHE